MPTASLVALYNEYRLQVGLWGAELGGSGLAYYAAIGANNGYPFTFTDTTLADATGGGFTELVDAAYARQLLNPTGVSRDDGGAQALVAFDNFDFGSPSDGGSYDTLFVMGWDGTDPADSSTHLFLAFTFPPALADGSAIDFAITGGSLIAIQ